jgi:hypothetical protein
MDPNNLEDQWMDEAYVGFLHTYGELPSTGRTTVYDGSGNTSSLSIGRNCEGISICGNLELTELPKVGDLDLESIINTLVDNIYPIGSVFLTTTNTNPSANFTNTSWELVSIGRFAAGIGTSLDVNSVSGTILNGYSLDGEYVHTLTVPQLATHTHTNPTLNQYYLTWPYTGTQPSIDATVEQQQSGSVEDYSAAGLSITILPVGGNQSFNITPPSFGIYFWKRLS